MSCVVCCVQSLLVVNVAFLLSIGLYSMPLYSLLVHMGGDYKMQLRDAVPLAAVPARDYMVCA